MSTIYKRPEDVPNEVLANRLNELATAVTNKRGTDFESHFTMRIPAECDRDADIVLSEAARRIQAIATGMPDGYRAVPNDLIEFLRGLGKLCGCMFGERPEGEPTY